MAKRRTTTKQMPNRIAIVRREHGMTQAELAERLNVHWVTISKLERGKMQLHTGWMEEIARVFDIAASDLIADRSETTETFISGYMEDGVYNELGENSFTIEMTDRPEGSEDNFWITVEGKGFWPQFHDGDCLQFAPVEEDEAALYVGRFVIVRDEGSINRCGFIIAVNNGGSIVLQVLNGPTIPDVEPKIMSVLVQVRYTAPWDLHLSSEEKIARGLAISALKG